MKNGTKTEPEREPKRNQPEGIRFKYREDRPKPYLMGWSDGGLHRWQAFADEETRADAAAAIAGKREEFGKEILNFDPREWRAWLDFKAKANGVEPMDILREWQAMRAANGSPTPTSITVADAVANYLKFRASGSLAGVTTWRLEKHLKKRFASLYGPLHLGAVTPKLIGEWLASLRSDRGGGPVGPLTTRHHRKDLNTFLKYCTREGWMPRNPCESVPVPAIAEHDVSLITVEQGKKLFSANADFPVAGRLALEAFGFLRSSSAGRLRKEHINFGDRGIRMPGYEHKSRKTKFRQGHPDNLWAWLDRAPDACWAMTPVQYRHEKHDAFVRAELDGSANRLRKTCISAHLAHVKNKPLTSYLAQHRDMTTTEIYEGVMTSNDGAAWFQILPPP